MDRIILVIYINMKNFNSDEGKKYLIDKQRELADASQINNTMSFLFPTDGESRVECINHQLVTKREYNKVLKVISDNNRILDDFINPKIDK